MSLSNLMEFEKEVHYERFCTEERVCQQANIGENGDSSARRGKQTTANTSERSIDAAVGHVFDRLRAGNVAEFVEALKF